MWAVMDLIEEYIDNIKRMKLSLDDCGDKRKVRKNNRIADRNIKIAETINMQEHLKMQFVTLLESENSEIRNRVAHHMIERMSFDKATRQKALKIIEDEAANSPDPLQRLGNEMWLKKYYSDNPGDRFTE
jgi:hypothetical protein